MEFSFYGVRKKNKRLVKLPNQCVDTGMGLERITAVLSNKTNNFDTDLFKYIIEEIEKITKVKANEKTVHSFRIISDHIRGIIFLMAEGILPSNEGRGYVLRRIIRRALMHVHRIKVGELLLNKLVKKVCNKYSKIYFELKKVDSFIENNLKNEEEKFSETLEVGLNLLEKEIKKLKSQDFSPELAFKLYDTYGFPIDMTQSILSEKKILLDLKLYKNIVEKNKSKQKKTWIGSGDSREEKVFLDLKNSKLNTNFLGYEKIKKKANLEKIIYKNESKKFIKGRSKDIILIFDSTPFYAESGGQVGDSGKLLDEDKKLVCDIYDTKKIDGNIFLHFAKTNFEPLEINKQYILEIDKIRRYKIRNNHSATHLLHESLRQVLGKHVSQRGSLVNEKKLRFDYTSNHPLSENQIMKIEHMVNDSIRLNMKTEINKMPVKDAINSGAIALFGEKYPDKVRVVSMSEKSNEDVISSKELCGGTHVDSTGQIGSFKIVGDYSISSGIRRVEAITGVEVEMFFNKKIKLLDEIKDILKATDDNLKNKILNIKNEVQNLKKISSHPNQVFSKDYILDIKKLNVYFQIILCEPKDLKNHCDQIKKSFQSGIIILLTTDKKKISVVVSITDDLLEKHDSIEILNKITFFLGGKKGGGRRDLAQGGAVFSKKIEELSDFFVKLFDN